jgi:hypothetical protein
MNLNLMLLTVDCVCKQIPQTKCLQHLLQRCSRSDVVEAHESFSNRIQQSYHLTVQLERGCLSCCLLPGARCLAVAVFAMHTPVATRHILLNQRFCAVGRCDCSAALHTMTQNSRQLKARDNLTLLYECLYYVTSKQLHVLS